MSAPPTAPPACLPLPVLLGERCLLRALVPADAASMREHADDADVARNLFDGFPRPYLQAHAEAWCRHEANSGTFGHVWGIVVDGAVIGCIGLVPQAGWLRCNAEAGYWIGAAYRRRGIASDALRQVADWAFAAMPELTRITATIFVGNDASQGVASRCGFVREGLLRQSAIKDGEVIDRVLWAAYRPTGAPRPANIDIALAASAANAMERA